MNQSPIAADRTLWAQAGLVMGGAALVVCSLLLGPTNPDWVRALIAAVGVGLLLAGLRPSVSRRLWSAAVLVGAAEFAVMFLASLVPPSMRDCHAGIPVGGNATTLVVTCGPNNWITGFQMVLVLGSTMGLVLAIGGLISLALRQHGSSPV